MMASIRHVTFWLLAPQSGAYTIAPHRDPIQPIQPIPSIPLIALEQERSIMCYIFEKWALARWNSLRSKCPQTGLRIGEMKFTLFQMKWTCIFSIVRLTWSLKVLVIWDLKPNTSLLLAMYKVFWYPCFSQNVSPYISFDVNFFTIEFFQLWSTSFLDCHEMLPHLIWASDHIHWGVMTLYKCSCCHLFVAAENTSVDLTHLQ